MSEIIGNPLQEIIDLDPDLDDLSWREICYIVALGMDEVLNRYWTQSTLEHHAEYDFHGADGTNAVFLWYAYHESWQHAGRVLESLPWFDIDGTHKAHKVQAGPSAPDIVQAFDKDLKKAITKAAAKCVLAGIELEVDCE